MSTRTALDELIYGWPKGKLALLYGHFKSGKTTLAMMACLISIDEGREAIYLDTENRITPMKFMLLAENMKNAGLIQGFDPSKLRLWSVTSLTEQHDVVMNEMVDRLSRGNVGVAVIDSIAYHYHRRVLNVPKELLAAEAREVQGKLATEIGNLQQLASKYETAVVVTTWNASQAKYALQDWQRKQVERAFSTGEMKPYELHKYIDILLGGQYGFDFVGGQWLGYRAHFLLRLFRLGSDLRYAYLVAHGDRPDGYGMYMVMREHGLVPVDGKVEKVSETTLKDLARKEEEVVAQEGGGDESKSRSRAKKKA